MQYDKCCRSIGVLGIVRTAIKIQMETNFGGDIKCATLVSFLVHIAQIVWVDKFFPLLLNKYEPKIQKRLKLYLLNEMNINEPFV